MGTARKQLFITAICIVICGLIGVCIGYFADKAAIGGSIGVAVGFCLGIVKT